MGGEDGRSSHNAGRRSSWGCRGSPEESTAHRSSPSEGGTLWIWTRVAVERSKGRGSSAMAAGGAEEE